MFLIEANNVNEMLVQGVKLLWERGQEISPRGIKTLEMDCPVCSTYRKPMERVLLIEERDANPFFHLFESLWILQGRQDVAWLSQFNSNIKNYSDDGKVFHAAYGHRLRHEQEFDQIKTAIYMLKEQNDTRQCVLQIWDANSDLSIKSKDIPCNDLIMLKVRNGKLNMTVCNRSNDIIWGAYGANVVQFSMLQEYIANKVGVGVGVYNQMSDSYHVYTDNPKYETLRELPYSDFNPYKHEVEPFPLGADHPEWDTELTLFCALIDPSLTQEQRVGMRPDVLEGVSVFQVPFFTDVVIPMYKCWVGHKMNRSGLMMIDSIKATDWKMAAEQWLTKREVK